MKNYKYILAGMMTAVMAGFTIVSCNKDITENEQLPTLVASSTDITAGNWTMLALDTTKITLAKPLDDTTKVYKAELAAVKKAQGELSAEQKNAIKFWSGGGILRWNQIFRDLVAKHNLPPEPIANGTYPIPDSENPFSFPQFPFANPPYAARAYAYVAAAQYDALKAAWHYKNKSVYTNRKKPYQQSGAGISLLLPESTLPGYPNEEAVMSGAAAEMLKVLFPADVEYITIKAAEQRNVALWSGKATASEIKNSLQLGKDVAAQFITRAKGDNMGNAVGTKAGWDTLSRAATRRGDIAWHSLETPARPPMLPYFGKVKPWVITTNDIIASRPVAPPLAGDQEMDAQVAEVKSYSKNLTRERLAIVHKWADGISTYTPPGHWNDIAEEYVRDAKLSEVSAARIFALLNITMENAAIACWDTKFAYYNARPTQLDASIKTGTGVPNFPSYVSGHSTFSWSAAVVLSHFFPNGQSEFEALATEAAASRLYGAIHYKIDCEKGEELGKTIGQFTINRVATVDGAE